MKYRISSALYALLILLAIGIIVFVNISFYSMPCEDYEAAFPYGYAPVRCIK